MKVGVGRSRWILRVTAYLELMKPRVNLLVVLTTGVGFYLASASMDLWLLFHTSFGTAILAGGTAVLNQFLEREADGRMLRTCTRPLPSGRLTAPEAMIFGSVLVLAGTLYLIGFTNSLAALLGCSTSALYLFVYTPLKVKTPLCTAVGAIPGALPPMIGWAAARGTLDLNAALLFAILFAWQFPHFLAISWLYREDYKRGGFAMLPAFDPDGSRTSARILGFSLLLLVLSVIPFISGLAGVVYLVGAVLLGVLFSLFGFEAARLRSKLSAQHVLRASVAYLPLLLILMIIDKA